MENMSNIMTKQFKELLKKEHLKLTTQRLLVFEEVFKSDEHRESEEIYFALKKKNLNISRATVYRTMDLLHKYGFVNRMDIGEGKWRYEHKLESQHHDHLICVKCGRIEEFISRKVEQVQEEVAKQYGYTLLKHNHQLFGICSDCSES